MTATVCAWVGVDPGAEDTGIVARVGRDLLAWDVIGNGYRQDPGIGVGPLYLHAVRIAIAELVEHAKRSTPQVVVAVEGLVAPTAYHDGRLAIIDPTGVIGTAVVYGMVLTVWPDAIVVPPNKHGRGILASYPAQLVTGGERRAGLNRAASKSSKVRERHARSAWDVTLNAPLQMKVQAAQARAKAV